MFIKFNRLLKLNLYFIILLFFSNNLNLSATDKAITNYSKEGKSSTINSYDASYLFDSGDVITINFSGLPIFSDDYVVDINGMIFLPEIYEYSVKGKSKKEIEKELTKKFEKFIKNPIITILLSIPRPLNVYLGGEIKSPGVYRFEYKTRELKKSDAKKFLLNSSKNVIIQRPKLFSAIKEAKGFTSKSDLSNIKIIRKNAQINGGGEIATKINFISLLNDGDQNQNIDLRDGDKVIIGRSEIPPFKQFLKINSSNISPSLINIYVTGAVEKSGKQLMVQGSSLFEAVASAGGKLNNIGTIKFIRFKEEGETIQRSIKYFPSSIKGSKNNPILLEGDVIQVRKNNLGQVTAIINEIGAPIINAYGIVSLFD